MRRGRGRLFFCQRNACSASEQCGACAELSLGEGLFSASSVGNSLPAPLPTVHAHNLTYAVGKVNLTWACDVCQAAASNKYGDLSIHGRLRCKGCDFSCCIECFATTLGPTVVSLLHEHALQGKAVGKADTCARCGCAGTAFGRFFACASGCPFALCPSCFYLAWRLSNPSQFAVIRGPQWDTSAGDADGGRGSKGMLEAVVPVAVAGAATFGGAAGDVNRAGTVAKAAATSGRYYCGRRGLYACPKGCDGTCGPSDGCQCSDCAAMSLQKGSSTPCLHQYHMAVPAILDGFRLRVRWPNGNEGEYGWGAQGRFEVFLVQQAPGK